VNTRRRVLSTVQRYFGFMKILRTRINFDLWGTFSVLMRLVALGLVLYPSATFAQGIPAPVSISFDFRNGSLGWEAGFADYPPATDKNDVYGLRAEIRSLPPELGVSGSGFYIQGMNRSDDLFMFLKRRLDSSDGLVAGQTYQVNFTLVFASDAQTGCAGAGGAPDIALKAGATPAEPIPLFDNSPLFPWLRMNVGKGGEGYGDLAASSTGSTANGIPCGSQPIKYVSVQRNHQHTSLVNASSRGELWLLVGTDSGFEGTTGLYYQRIDVTLTPVSSPPPPVLLTDQNTGRAVAVDSVSLLKEPFFVTSEQNFFSLERRTRVTLFGYNLELKNGEDVSAITAQAEDSQHRIYALPVEAAVDIPRFTWIKQVTIKLPEELQGLGDLSVKIAFRGVTSNPVLISVK
jgi:hypothetical protein